ncbi:MAG: hypothetical protein JWO30_4310 [Fibrobacteres bacterium]|nr:hypothetical protein [Fibrobacterota bacterium]
MNFMLSARRILAVSFGLFALTGCGQWKVDSSELTARSASTGAGPDCAGCHAYPLMDRNHDYHLNKTAVNQELNGKITCMDCHSQSIRFHAITAFDSVYEDTTGERWGTLAHPGPGDTTAGGTVIRSMVFVRVDTLPQHQPIPMEDRPGAAPKFQEYITGLAHMNNKVDVVFDSRNSRPDEFEGDSASYNPTQETCSAVACHPGPKIYSWGSVAKGLPELKDKDPGNP